MARKDWWYPNVPVEQAEALDHIVEKIGGKLGVSDKKELVRKIISEYIQCYEEKYGIIQPRRSVRQPGGKDAQRPVDAT